MMLRGVTALSLLLALAGCGADDEKSTSRQPTATQAPASTPRERPSQTGRSYSPPQTQPPTTATEPRSTAPTGGTPAAPGSKLPGRDDPTGGRVSPAR